MPFFFVATHCSAPADSYGQVAGRRQSPDRGRDLRNRDFPVKFNRQFRLRGRQGPDPTGVTRKHRDRGSIDVSRRGRDRDLRRQPDERPASTFTPGCGVWIVVPGITGSVAFPL